MELWLITLILCVVFGIIGAATRIGFQRWSNKKWPHETLDGYLVALGLGAIGGWLSWELPKYIDWNYDRLGAFVLGYFLPDIIENLLEGFKPPIGD